jgi:hypothetical protein
MTGRLSAETPAGALMNEARPFVHGQRKQTNEQHQGG